jgi:hypothetical protein
MDEFHLADWPRRTEIADQFQDERYRILALRIIHAHAAEHLADEVRREQESLIASRLMAQGIDEPAWLTLEMALQEAIEMMDGCEPAEAEMLQEFRQYVEGRIVAAEAVLNRG